MNGYLTFACDYQPSLTLSSDLYDMSTDTAYTKYD